MTMSETLPMAKPTAPVRSFKNHALQILAVDDDPLIRRLNAQALIRAGYRVAVAEDGAVAWNMMQLNHYDLLLTDNSMPKVTGMELVKMVRAAQLDLPVVMATAAPPAQALIDFPRLQPVAVLLKPYSPAELVSTVRSILEATRIRANATFATVKFDRTPFRCGE